MGSSASVLVTGATGFVGKRLVPELVERGHTVKAMTRNPDDVRRPRQGCVRRRARPGHARRGARRGRRRGLPGALAGRRRLRAQGRGGGAGFGLAAAAVGVRQIVYLGGLGEEDGDLSAHLRSRREVERLLGESGVPVTVLRAAIVVGAGGISWEITRQLVKNLPAMVVPKWASTLSQPIGIDDVVRYLAGVIDNDEAMGRVFEIGGPDQLSYVEMLQQAAEVMNGHRVPVVTVPVLTPSLSSRWIGFVTDVDSTTGRNLIDSMSTEVVVHDDSIKDVVPGEPVSYQEAVRRAVEESRTE